VAGHVAHLDLRIYRYRIIQYIIMRAGLRRGVGEQGSGGGKGVSMNRLRLAMHAWGRGAAAHAAWRWRARAVRVRAGGLLCRVRQQEQQSTSQGQIRCAAGLPCTGQQHQPSAQPGQHTRPTAPTPSTHSTQTTVVSRPIHPRPTYTHHKGVRPIVPALHKQLRHHQCVRGCLAQAARPPLGGGERGRVQHKLLRGGEEGAGAGWTVGSMVGTLARVLSHTPPRPRSQP